MKLLIESEQLGWNESVRNEKLTKLVSSLYCVIKNEWKYLNNEMIKREE